MQIVLPENASHIIICTNENEAAQVITKGISKKGCRIALCHVIFYYYSIISCTN